MNQEWGEDDPTPTAADLDAAYGSRNRLGLDIGNKQTRDELTKVWMKNYPSWTASRCSKCVIGCWTLPKPIALNTTNRTCWSAASEGGRAGSAARSGACYGADQEPAGADGARLAVKSAVRTRDINTEAGTFTGTSTCCGNRTAAG